MNTENNQLERLIDFADDPNLAIFSELQDISDTLIKISEKETPEFPTFPKVPEPLEEVSIKNFPDVQKVEVVNFPLEKEVDLTETNNLLKRLLNKEIQDTDIVVTLKIE